MEISCLSSVTQIWTIEKIYILGFQTEVSLDTQIAFVYQLQIDKITNHERIRNYTN